MSRVLMQRARVTNGGRALARAIGIQMLRLEGSQFRARVGDLIFNWGNGRETLTNADYINKPESVAIACDKIATFAMLQEACVPTVTWTTDPQTARHWLVDGIRVITRALTRGSQGRGMTVYSWGGTEHSQDYNRFCEADTTPLYVQVFGDVQTNEEYRVHVMDGEVIDRQMKRRRSRENGYEGTINPYIRSSSNGWVFCRQGLGDIAALDDAAIEAVSALGLDFGAVDIARSATGEVCVYEVNTAPGLEGTTLTRYTDASASLIERRRSSAAA